MNNVRTYHYKGSPVSFDFSSNHKLINATEMARPFGKKPNHFLRLNQTQDFISVLRGRVANSQLVKTTHGNNGATWMHEKLAIKFAAWLSPEFELWIYDRIKELLTLKSPLDALNLLVAQLNEQEKLNNEFSERLTLVEARTTTRSEDYFTISGYATTIGAKIPHKQAQTLGRLASRLSREMDIEIGSEHDAKYGRINSYHISVLQTLEI